MPTRVVLCHWHEDEAAARVATLCELGYDAIAHWDQAASAGSPVLKSLTTTPPAAVVIDLGRLPSHGVAFATWLRERKGTRHLPLVFVPGDPEKTDRIRERFPDAAFAPWSKLRTALPRAIASPPRNPVVPKTPDYSGTPLPKKLGITDGSRVVLVRAPEGFAATLAAPAGARITTRLAGSADVIVLFCSSFAELHRDFARASKCLAERGGLWVAWPKKASGRATDLDEGLVRSHGLETGLVDNKVCAIDAVWSGLRFVRRSTAGATRR